MCSPVQCLPHPVLQSKEREKYTEAQTARLSPQDAFDILCENDFYNRLCWCIIVARTSVYGKQQVCQCSPQLTVYSGIQAHLCRSCQCDVLQFYAAVTSGMRLPWVALRTAQTLVVHDNLTNVYMENSKILLGKA